MTSDPEQVRAFAERYTAAWCSTDQVAGGLIAALQRSFDDRGVCAPARRRRRQGALTPQRGPADVSS
jgi:hypothetical protein